MRKIIIVMLFLISCATYSQGISASALHDGKLGLGLDKTHNNGKPVLDLILTVDLEGKQFEWYYFSVQMLFETANLKETNFQRYGVNLMWNFNKLIIKDLTVGLGLGGFMIDREGMGVTTYSFSSDVFYEIVDGIYIVVKNELLRRNDLPTPHTGYNFSAGIKVKIR